VRRRERRASGKRERGKGMVLPDGIHLTAAGQRYLASQLLPLIN